MTFLLMEKTKRKQKLFIFHLNLYLLSLKMYLKLSNFTWTNLVNLHKSNLYYLQWIRLKTSFDESSGKCVNFIIFFENPEKFEKIVLFS